MAPHLLALLAQFHHEFSELGLEVADREGQGQDHCLAHILTQGICKGCLVRRPRCLALTASADGTAKLWSTRTGECLHTFSGHARGLNSAVFVPNNPEQILTASADSTVRYWSVRSGACLKTMRLIEGRGQTPVNVLSAMMSPDGQLLIVNYQAPAPLSYTLVSLLRQDQPPCTLDTHATSTVPHWRVWRHRAADFAGDSCRTAVMRRHRRFASPYNWIACPHMHAT